MTNGRPCDPDLGSGADPRGRYIRRPPAEPGSRTEAADRPWSGGRPRPSRRPAEAQPPRSRDKQAGAAAHCGCRCRRLSEAAINTARRAARAGTPDGGHRLQALRGHRLQAIRGHGLQAIHRHRLQAFRGHRLQAFRGGPLGCCPADGMRQSPSRAPESAGTGQAIRRGRAPHRASGR